MQLTEPPKVLQVVVVGMLFIAACSRGSGSSSRCKRLVLDALGHLVGARLQAGGFTSGAEIGGLFGW